MECSTVTFGAVPCWSVFAVSVSIGVTWALTFQLLANLALCRARRGKEGVGVLAQQLSEFVAYTTMLTTSVVFVTRTPCFAERGGPSCWPSVIGGVCGLDMEHLVVYMVQIAAYSSMIVTERLLAVLVGDSARPGVDTVIHHALTMALLFGSIGPWSPIGALVPLTHDASTVPLKLARVLQAAGCKRASQAAFTTFALFFLAARLLAFPYLCLRPGWAHAIALHATGSPEAAPVAALSTGLSLLLVINLVWFYKIVGMVCRGPTKRDGSQPSASEVGEVKSTTSTKRKTS